MLSFLSILQNYKKYCKKMAEDPVQRFIKPGSHKGKGLAVFTSGGDSQGNLKTRDQPKPYIVSTC